MLTFKSRSVLRDAPLADFQERRPLVAVISQQGGCTTYGVFVEHDPVQKRLSIEAGNVYRWPENDIVEVCEVDSDSLAAYVRLLFGMFWNEELPLQRLQNRQVLTRVAWILNTLSCNLREVFRR